MTFFEKFRYRVVENRDNNSTRNSGLKRTCLIFGMILVILILVSIILFCLFGPQFITQSNTEKAEIVSEIKTDENQHLLSTESNVENQIKVTEKDENVIVEKSKPCSNKLIPGIERMQRGIDITILNLFPGKDLLTQSNGFGKSLIEFSCNQDKVWAHPTKPELFYARPDQVASVNSVPSGLLAPKIQFYESMASYKNSLEHSVGLSFGFFGSFSASRSYKDTQEHILKSNKSVVEVLAQLSAIQVDFQSSSKIQLNDEALEYVQYKLPSKYELNPRVYDEFVDLFGTHYFETALFGGYLFQKTIVDNEYLYDSTEKEVSNKIELSFFEKVGFNGGYSDANKKIDENFRSHTERSFHYYGGYTDLINLGKEQQQGRDSHWWDTVKEDPWLSSGKLRPIEELIHNETIRAQVKKAVLFKRARAYLGEIENVLDLTKVKLNNTQMQQIKTIEQQLSGKTASSKNLLEFGHDIDELFVGVQTIRDEALLREYSIKLSDTKTILDCKISLVELCNERLFQELSDEMDKFYAIQNRFSKLIKKRSNGDVNTKAVQELIQTAQKLIAHHTRTKVNVCEFSASKSTCEKCFDDMINKVEFCQNPKALRVVLK